MTESLLRTELFPTTIFVGGLGFTESQHSNLCDVIYAEREVDQAGIELSNYANLGGWHSRANLHRDAEFALVTRRIREAATEVGQSLGYDPQRRLEIDALWAIVNSPGASNRSHLHPGALWSGVYYVQAGDNAGAIELEDPRTANLMHQPRYATRPESCQASVLYNPVPGRLLLFPGWLYHSVHPNLSKTDRIILSFNLSQH